MLKIKAAQCICYGPFALKTVPPAGKITKSAWVKIFLAQFSEVLNTPSSTEISEDTVFLKITDAHTAKH